ncbi:MAG: restriction endonuclease subunit S, partial [Verrucomicrobiota bacterium]
MIEEELPDSWEIAPLDELATFQNGRAFKKPEWKTTGLPIIRIQNLNDHNAAFNYTPAEHEPQFKIRDGDLLFAWAASLGVYLWKRGNAWLNQHIFRVAPEIGVEKLYLYYLLQNAIDHFYAKARGSGMVHITKGELVGTHLPLPPLNEQKRIVAKIEELFSELDAGEESLRKARRQLGVYRQSLLKQAFESKLTAPWRAQHPHLLESPDQLLARIQAERGSLHSQRLENWEKEVKIWKKRGEQGKRPTKPRKPEDPTRLSAEENAELVKLPRGWCWMTLESLSSPKSRSIQSGPFGSSLKHEEFTDEGILVIGIDNVQKG